jgi:S-DNA-T family DNA segregation ATPase FtsK/SpoIIIE
MPHLLVAGTTGSGKSVCLNSVILSILLLQHPKNLKLLLIDPKMVEFSPFKSVPHLITPVVTDMKRAAAILEWAVNKMDERYALLARAGVRNISAYNKLDESTKRKRLNPEGDATIDEETFFMPHLVIIVDELADLMMVASKEVESSIIRISQKSRAVGIHLIVATQRPSVDVITGLIKSNLPSRIAFYVFSKVDSRTILDQNGAEKLLGKGDMLFLPPGTSKLERVQGTFVSDEEVNRIVEFLKERTLPEFSPELKKVQTSQKNSDAVKDELYDEAIRIILESQRGSVSLLQRRLEIGYSRAARLIDLMAEDGFVGEYKGSQAREVYITLDEWGAQRNQN